jgi:uncharacterized protein with NRDE domain
MCTIVLLVSAHPTFPLVVAANRDEFYTRAAEPPRVLLDGPTRAVGGRDRARSGTWMGATAAGFFAGVTNQRTGHPADTSLRSRGEVVLEALRRGDPEAVSTWLGGLDGASFNPFNLAFGRAGDVRVAYVRREDPSVTIVRLAPGVHTLANDVLGSAHFPKAGRANARAARITTGAWEPTAASLTALLADHETPPDEVLPPAPPGSLMPDVLVRRLQALCVHTPVYGTVSSTLMALEPSRVARYAYADGSPCRTNFRDVTALFEG